MANNATPPPDPLAGVDKVAERTSKYSQAVLMAGAVLAGGFAIVAHYVLPHIRAVASPVWLLLSLVAVAFASPRLRHIRACRYVYTIFAVCSLGAWGYSLTELQSAQAIDAIPYYRFSVLKSTYFPDKVDPVKVRQEEREKMEAEYKKLWERRIELAAAWLWLASCLVWALALVYAITETEKRREP